MGDKTPLIVQMNSPKDLGFKFTVCWYWLLFFFHCHMYVRVNSLHSIDPHMLKKKKLDSSMSLQIGGCAQYSVQWLFCPNWGCSL